MGKASKVKTVPQPVQGGATVPRAKLKGSAASLAALEAIKAAARAVEEAQREERRADSRSTEAHLAVVEREARGRGEEVRRDGAGPLHVARDGLVWALRKATIDPVHYDAGLRFRADYETANGTGVSSCLKDPGAPRAFNPHTAGPTAAMMVARDHMKMALADLGTPLLHGYVQLVAGEGVMLTDPRIGGSKGAGDHVLPCRIAFDLLARHYGMIR